MSTIQAIIVACAVLHNIAIDFKEDVSSISADLMQIVERDVETNIDWDFENNFLHLNNGRPNENNKAKFYRSHVINNHFGNL